MITFKINKLPYQFPTCWDDVTYRQSVALLDSKTLTDHIHIFTGIPKETLEAAELKNLEKISLALSFLSFAPNWDRTNMVGRYIMPLDVTIQSVGQFEDLRVQLLKMPQKPQEEPKVFADLCLTACAIYCQKLRDGKYDPNKVDEVKEELKDCSCSEVMGTGAFFFTQAIKFITEFNESLPEIYPTPEEYESGLTDLSKDFPFSATLFRTSREMSINPGEFSNDWNVREFYHLVRYLSWESKAQHDYQELMAAKARAANKPK